MFNAGLELDLKMFTKNKSVAIAFALLSFAIPFTLGMHERHGCSATRWAAAVLMGSNWGSHTLVTYPMLRKMGLSRNRAVATVVGATAVTDTSALLVLAGVSGAIKRSGSFGRRRASRSSSGSRVLGDLVPARPAAAGALVLRPRRHRPVVPVRVRHRRVPRRAACSPRLAGIDGIVGAFFAGLGLDRAIPEQSPLMERVQFIGSTLFVPIFLVSVGMLLDPRVMVDPKTLLRRARVHGGGARRQGARGGRRGPHLPLRLG